MTSPTYFFINNTRKEFCTFHNDVPVFGAIGSFMNDKIGWKYTHEIEVATDKKASAKDMITTFLNAEYKDITNTLRNLKQKRTFMDRLMCRSISVVYPLWEVIYNMPASTDTVKEVVAEVAMKNLDTMTITESTVATSL
jgi:hypothetical protein